MIENQLTLLARHISKPYERPSDTLHWLQILHLALAPLNEKDPRRAKLRDVERELLALLSDGAQPPHPPGLSTF